MITHIRQVSLGVPKPAAARDFYEGQWQLEVVAADDNLVYLGTASAERATACGCARPSSRGST
jgi:catechol 2,3-dioxygenase-like lactoylglutathione lyase family enzyme